MQWVSVKERLPELGIPILVTNRVDSDKHIWIANGVHEDENKPSIVDGKYCAFDHMSMQRIWGVTHWMQLPAPPTGFNNNFDPTKR